MFDFRRSVLFTLLLLFHAFVLYQRTVYYSYILYLVYMIFHCCLNLMVSNRMTRQHYRKQKSWQKKIMLILWMRYSCQYLWILILFKSQFMPSLFLLIGTSDDRVFVNLYKKWIFSTIRMFFSFARCRQNKQPIAPN